MGKHAGPLNLVPGPRIRLKMPTTSKICVGVPCPSADQQYCERRRHTSLRRSRILIVDFKAPAATMTLRLQNLISRALWSASRRHALFPHVPRQGCTTLVMPTIILACNETSCVPRRQLTKLGAVMPAQVSVSFVVPVDAAVTFGAQLARLRETRPRYLSLLAELHCHWHWQLRSGGVRGLPPRVARMLDRGLPDPALCNC